MKITLINPNIVTQKGDFSGSGIPYMPIGLAYLASYLREQNHDIQVIDAFGEAPHKVRKTKTQYIQGLTPEEVVERISPQTQAIGFYAHLTVAHNTLLEIIHTVKKHYPDCYTFVLENINKVNAYSLRQVYHQFFNLGIDYVVLGYLERRTHRLIEAIQKNKSVEDIDGIIVRNREDKFLPPVDFSKENDLDTLPFPAWDLFPVENYWQLGYSHGPLTTGRYLPLLTSRGCPYNCGFCMAPEVSNRKWKARSAENIVSEIVYFKQKFGVNEFHIEDLNPTLNKKRIIELCRLLIEKNVHITWKLAQGTKLESLDRDTIDLLAKAGCNYISISPESGSPRMLKLMNKPVNLQQAVEVVEIMREKGIYTQACFVLGYPGETRTDREQTAKLVRKLAKAGVDEIALFIITPMPGSKIFQQYRNNFKTLDQLTFTPRWRQDYRVLSIFRKKLYFQYCIIKSFYYPSRMLGYLWALLTRRFKTKVEMTIFRKLKVAWLAISANKNTKIVRINTLHE